MKKIRKNEKNFQKGYLQIAFYVVNYGKIRLGIYVKRAKNARKTVEKTKNSHTDRGQAAAGRERIEKRNRGKRESGKARHYRFRLEYGKTCDRGYVHGRTLYGRG